ncbi:MAG: magnesium chelatase subunit D [Myxococcales bacterium]|nr:magnesium chelatase subunit D [Myxococcales bacterium]
MDPLDVDARWADAALAIELLAIDPWLAGGVVFKAWPGPVRDQVCAWVTATVSGPVLRLPLHITDDRLLGGLALTQTLQRGEVVLEKGLLGQADGGVLLVPMAERLPTNLTALLAAALDQGQLTIERDGVGGLLPCRVGVVALDEGLEDEATPLALSERLAMHVDLREVTPRSEPSRQPDATRVVAARARLAKVEVADALVEVLCQAALALGVPSVRSPLLAVAIARAHAALEGRVAVEEDDVAVAARLVLGPRATRLPESAPAPDDAANDSPPPPDDERDGADDDGGPGDEGPDVSTAEVVLAAARSAIPPDVLELLTVGRAQRTGPRSTGKVGAARASTLGGRPAGNRAGVPQPGERLNVVETLRAAAPWQRLRRTDASSRRVEVRKDDLRVKRFVQRTESVVIFCVDASGSSALQRLAEAKGAVEQVLGDCYVRRDHVALVAFRGSLATLVLPPTRSLARARKCLAELAGGGGTPMAAGIDAATGLALEARRRGRSPLVVMMTDGRANVGRPGSHGLSPQEEALRSARLLRAQQVRALFLDTSPRPRPQARALALEMGARYLPLPHLDARVVSSQVQGLTEAK